jgi:hypothetical protein
MANENSPAGYIIYLSGENFILGAGPTKEAAIQHAATHCSRELLPGELSHGGYKELPGDPYYIPATEALLTAVAAGGSDTPFQITGGMAYHHNPDTGIRRDNDVGQLKS